MATLASGEVVTAKRALAVMAGHAACPRPLRVMIERCGRSDLSSLRHSRPDLMAFGAGNLLMLGVIKADAECRGHFRCPGITTQLVTRPARRDIAATGLSPRSVTPIAGRVRIETGGYRQGHAGARRLVTRRTANAAHAQMTRVIELHAKALQTWERFQSA